MRLLSSNGDGMTLTEISAMLALPKSSVFDIVHTLTEEGFLECPDPRRKTYRIGPELFRIGHSYLAGASLDSIARPILTELNRQVNETVFLALRSGKHDFVYIMKFLSDAEFQTAYSVGSVRHLLSTALGKAILAALPDDQALAAVTPEMYSDCSIPDIYDSISLLSFLNKSRSMGFVVDATSENSHAALPVAAPILDIDNQVVGAASIVARADRSTEERIHRLGKLVESAALRISNGLGYMKNDLYAAAIRR